MTTTSDDDFRAGPGERRLMSAVLLDALRILRQGRPGNTRREAWSWIHDDFDPGPFAFCLICEVLGLDPVAIRHALAGNLLNRARPQL